MIKLSPQQKLIVDYLRDGDWHCMAGANFFMKDDRKRISELNQKGFVIQGVPCDKEASGCTVNHNSNVYMRRIVEKPMRTIETGKQASDGKWYKVKETVPALF